MGSEEFLKKKIIMKQMTLLKNQDDQSISYFNNFQLVRKFQFLFPTLQIELWIIPYLRNSETLGKLPIA